MNDMNLLLPELHRAFAGRKFFGKADLRNFYRNRSPSLSEPVFRRILYTLERRKQIAPVDSGVYRFSSGSNSRQPLKKFTPSFSDRLRQIYQQVNAAFPYAETLIWETRLLHEFMLHQPGQSQVILETEKDVSESVFNFLNARLPGNVFLQPDHLTFERYILPHPDSIVITSLLSQTPHHKVEGIATPRLEKILVDIFVDEDLFFIFQGEELAHIFDTAFELYRVSQKAIFRYAQRRKQAQKLRDFLQKKTRIQLLQVEDLSA